MTGPAGGVVLDLDRDLQVAWAGRDPFDVAMSIEGRAVREVAERSTLRVVIAGQAYYIKRHFGVGWAEILKNLLTLKRPVVDASNEYEAIRALAAAGLNTLSIAGYGCEPGNPARRRSFLVTRELTGTDSLEQVCLRWPEKPPDPAGKRMLIRRVAAIAARMHRCGYVHQDFYLCHLLLGGSGLAELERYPAAPIYVVDLHRAIRHDRIPGRALVKDLGGLYFSALEIGLTRRDVLRFLRGYFDAPLRVVLRERRALLRACERRAGGLFGKARRKGILPRQLAGIDP